MSANLHLPIEVIRLVQAWLILTVDRYSFLAIPGFILVFLLDNYAYLARIVVNHHFVRLILSDAL